jgi:hypothetical protein
MEALETQLALLGDRLAAAEAYLEEEKRANLRVRFAAMEQQLLAIMARLQLLWQSVLGAERPKPWDMQLTATGEPMSAEGHWPHQKRTCGTRRGT